MPFYINPIWFAVGVKLPQRILKAHLSGEVQEPYPKPICKVVIYNALDDGEKKFSSFSFQGFSVMILNLVD